jgi:hypothetical protein
MLSRLKQRQAKEVLVDSTGSTFDPDLDVQPRRHAREPLEPYQRLVANPFLAVLAWIFIAALVDAAVRSQNLPLFLTAIGLLFVAFFLLQFHCLDCGATGWVLRYRKHACPPVVARWQSRTVRRFHGPSMKSQLVGWFIVIPSAVVLGLIMLRSRL